MYKIILLMVLPILLYANIGKITASRGDVKVIRDSKEISAKSGTILEENDHVKTSKNGKLQIVFVDKTVFTLGKNSTLDISEYLYDESRPKKNKVKFAVLKGAFSTITGRIGKLNKSKFKLRTKSASIGIRGTIVKANQTMVMCTQGAITVTSIVSGDSVRVEAGYKTETKGDTVTAPSEIKSGDVESLGVDKMKVSKVITPVETIKPKVILPTVVSPQAKKVIMTGRTIASDGSQQLVTIDGETFDDAIADSGLQAVDDS